LQPSKKAELKSVNASQRITGLFLELLERQFPIDQEHQQVKHKTPSDFAKQLAVHVNHLNKAIKEVTQKTTTQIIAERYLREAKILLKHSIWNVSEIAFALGFKEVPHFNYFFKKYSSVSPMQFRKN
jgi:AraC-like DNA-binding protein